ncbi:hypothetical protein D3C84_860500 [compost metagenome]
MFALWGLKALTLTLMAIGEQGATWQLLGTVVAMPVGAMLFQSLLLVTVVGLFARGLLKALHGNNHGLCSGKTPDDSASDHDQDLTDGLTVYLNTLAGLPTEGRLVTFGFVGHRSEPTGNKPENEGYRHKPADGQWHPLPRRRPGVLLRPAEWARLFPKQMMDFLDQLRQCRRRRRSRVEGAEPGW